MLDDEIIRHSSSHVELANNFGKKDGGLSGKQA
jgi:hypothetical protein